MPRNITVQFSDGTTHVYQNAPDSLTPEQAEARARKDFPGKSVAGLDGGRKAGNKAPTLLDKANAFADRNINPVLRTLNRNALPFMDEAADGLQAVSNLVQGRATSPGEAWAQARSAGARDVAYLEATRPKTAALTRGVGLAGQALVPAGVGARAVAAAPSLGQAAVRSGVLGATAGGVSGYGAGEGQNRSRSAIEGAAVGGAFGTALPFAVPAVSALVDRASPVIRQGLSAAAPMVEGVGRAVPAVDDLAGNVAARMRAMAPGGVANLSTPEQIALRHIARNLQASGLSLDDLRSAPDSITAAEALGRTGQRQLGALARMEGRTGDDLAAKIAERRAGRPDLLKEEFARATGVAPDDAMGAIQSVVTKGRAEAAPLYDAAYQAGPFDSPALNGLMGRPSLKRAMRKAYRLAAEEGENPEALGLVNMDIMDQWAVTDPADFGATQTAQKTVRGPSRAPSQGPSLVKFLADSGGIDDVGGDLAAMDAGSWHKGRAYQRPLIGRMSADDAALKAWQAGYFPGRQDRPDINELLDAVSRELRGKPTYARAADQGAADRFAARNAADEAVYYGYTGEDPPMETDYGLRPEPVGEPVFTSLPTAKTWDYVKRGLDEVLDGYRDATTGRLPNNNEVRAVQETLKALRSELVSANKAYGQALNVSSDYLGAQDAFYRSQKLFLNPNVTEEQFSKSISRLSGSEKAAFKAGIANQMFDSAQNGKLDPRMFKADRVREKMRLVFGERDAQSLISTLEIETQKAAFENRYGPAAGSITADMVAGGEELAQSVGGGPLTVGQMVMNPVQAAKTGAEALINRIYLGATQPGQAAARDAIGQNYLMSPQQLAALLEANPVNVPAPAFPGPRAPNPFAFTPRAPGSSPRPRSSQGSRRQ